jgi:hypothetical protein
MRSVRQRSAAILLAALLAAGIAGVTRAAAAGEVSAARAAGPKPLPAPVMPRPKAPSGDEPVELLVGLKKGSDRGASAARFERTTTVEVTDEVPLPNVVTVAVAAADSAAALATLREDPSVAYAEVNGIGYAFGVEPTDPWAWRQWNLDQTAVPAAWQRTTGSDDVTIAVIDSGVTAVPDLAGAVLPGKNFVTKVGAKPTDTVTDDAGHGTMVASVIAANTDNGAGIAGVCWVCRILPVKVLDGNGQGTYADIAAGINYAVSQQVDIINLSLGGDTDSAVLRAAVTNALNHDIVVVAAAGNEGGTAREFLPNYPAGTPGVLSVGATDENDSPFAFSSKGSWISLAAPGEVWADATDGEPDLALGTSFSAPLVAGTAALILANHPEATPTEVKDALLATTDDIGGTFGGGRVNAARAVTKLAFTGTTAPSVRITGPQNRIRRAATTIGLVTGADVVSVKGTDGDGDLGTDTAAPWEISWTPTVEGAHSVRLLVTNTAGSETVAVLPLTADLTAPTVTGATPAHLAMVRGVVPVGATGVADTYGVDYAALYADGVLVGKDTTAPYAVRYPSTKRNGTVRLEWRIFDRAGNSTVYKRSIVADNTAPAVKITSGPKNKAKVKGTVKLKVSATDHYGVGRVELLINGKVVGTDRTSAYTFSVKVAKYSKKMKVRVRAVDAVGNVKYAATRNWTR